MSTTRSFPVRCSIFELGMKKSTRHDGRIGFLGAASIGIGGMVGGGIFAVLGLAVQLAHGGTPVAFLIAGIVALLTSYSYVRLSLTYPSQGGTVIFVDKAFGIDLFTGTMNNLLWLSYIVMLALYAHAFGSYAASFFPPGSRGAAMHIAVTLAILMPAVLNFVGAKAVGKAETYIVAVKIALLVLFIAVGFWGIDWQRMSFAKWSPPVELFAGGMIIFLAYEGFELIANAAGDMADRKKTLPRSLYASVLFVIVLYVLVAVVAVGNLPVSQIVEAKDYALAAAARPFLGQTGFVLIAIAALLSTFSAINATLYGSARLSYTIAQQGELPPFLEDKVWNKPIEGLIITTVLALALANFADLTSISMMGSAGFLVIFAVVNLANVKLAGKTDSKAWLSVSAAVACMIALGALLIQTAVKQPWHILVLVGLIVGAGLIEGAWMQFRRRPFKRPPSPDHRNDS